MLRTESIIKEVVRIAYLRPLSMVCRNVCAAETIDRKIDKLQLRLKVLKNNLDKLNLKKINKLRAMLDTIYRDLKFFEVHN